MHVLTILHRILSTSAPEIHAKRLASLMAAVETAVTGSRLTLSDMGRGLSGSVAVKHNIKRIDRLVGFNTRPALATISSFGCHQWSQHDSV
jgi:hypothetical protein